jgi:drug/metabolite transporter superfamily protein YnfA
MPIALVGAGRLGAIPVFAGATALEVLGDARIRKGMRGSGLVVVGLGMAVLGAYGVVVNLLDLDFSRLLGAYVGIFAIVSVVVGRLMFNDQVPVSTWIGLAVILVGSMIIHAGRASRPEANAAPSPRPSREVPSPARWQ